MVVGVLALQGAFHEHMMHLRMFLDVEGKLIKKREDLHGIDGLILPGGESTVMRKLLLKHDMLEEIKSLVENGLPVWGTCAGMILLAHEIEGEDSILGCMSIKVRRNAYGNQADSFCTERVIPKISSAEHPLVFIRAPWVCETKGEVLLVVDGHIVMVEEDNMLVTSFHPELTNDYSIHEYFLNKIRGR